MKNLILPFILLTSLSLFAQNKSNLVLFTDGGEPFFAFVNSVKQNDVASANVKIADIPTESLRLKIVFADQNLGEFTRNVMTQFGYESTIMIKKNNKGVFVLRPVSEPVAINMAPERVDSQPIIVYHSEETPVVDSRPVVVEQTRPAEVTQTVQETVVITNSGVNGTTTQERVDISIGVPGINVQMNINDALIHENDMNMNVGVTTTTTTSTTTTTTTGIQDNDRDRDRNRDRDQFERERTPPVEIVEEPLVPGYSGPIGCNGFLLSDSQINTATNTIKNQSFEDTKMTTARQIISSSCVTTAQVKTLMALFTFEDSKLTFAKEAYARTYDIGNYWMLSDAFTFSSSIDDLNNYINSRK